MILFGTRALSLGQVTPLLNKKNWTEPNRYVSTFDSHPANVVFLLRSVWFSVFCLQNGLFLSDFASFDYWCRGGLTRRTVGRCNDRVHRSEQPHRSNLVCLLDVLNHVTRAHQCCFTSQLSGRLCKLRELTRKPEQHKFRTTLQNTATFLLYHTENVDIVDSSRYM